MVGGSTKRVHDHQLANSPAFNGGDIGDVENGDNGDDMSPTKKLMYRLENHPPEGNKMSVGQDSPRGSSEEPVAQEADVVDDVAEEGEDEEPLPANQVGCVHHDEG